MMRRGRAAGNRPSIPWGRLSVYLLGVFLGALDTNVLGPVFPLLMHAFRTSLAWVAWTVTVYTVAYVAGTVLFGAWGDRAGHRRIFAWGILGFGVASVIAAVSPSLPVFLVARMVQGAAAGAVYPNAQAEGLGHFPPERKGLALGIFGAAFGVASIIGPTLGGALGQVFGWPAVFLLNAPLAVVVLLLVRRVPGSAPLPRPVPDPYGAAAFAVTVSSVLLGVTVGGAARWAFAVPAVAGAAVFWVRQRGARSPFLDTRPLVGAAGVVLVAVAAVVGFDMSAAVFVPTVAQRILHFGVLGSGAALLPAAFAGAALAGVGGHLCDRIGSRPVLIMGLAAGMVGALLLAVPSLTFARFIVSMVFFGVGTAFTMGAPLNRMGVALYRADQTAEALSLMAVFRSVGLAVGPVVLTAAAARQGFSGMFMTVAVVSAAAGLLLLIVRGAFRAASDAPPRSA